MITTTTGRPATDKQVRYVDDLLAERQVDAGFTAFARQVMHQYPTTRQASVLIDQLLGYPVKPPTSRVPAVNADQALVPGVYRKDGRVYVVKFNRAKTHLYAKRVVESAPRLTEAGTEVDFELEYAPAVVKMLTREHRVTLADAEGFLTRYARCVCCGRRLKAASSVREGIGPVCAKMFA